MKLLRILIASLILTQLIIVQPKEAFTAQYIGPNKVRVRGVVVEVLANQKKVPQLQNLRWDLGSDSKDPVFKIELKEILETETHRPQFPVTWFIPFILYISKGSSNFKVGDAIELSLKVGPLMSKNSPSYDGVWIQPEFAELTSKHQVPIPKEVQLFMDHFMKAFKSGDDKAVEKMVEENPRAILSLYPDRRKFLQQLEEGKKRWYSFEADAQVFVQFPIVDKNGFDIGPTFVLAKKDNNLVITYIDSRD